MADPVIDWIAQNFLLIYFFLMNMILIFVLFRLRMTLGPFFTQSVRVSFGLIRDPNLFIQLLNSKTAVLEWRSYSQVIKLDPEDATSELVYVDRQHGWTPVTPIGSKGFFSLFGFGMKPAEKLKTIYTDDFVPVSIASHKSYYVFGRQMHFVFEGQNITQNPLESFSQDAQVKKAGIAVEHQLIANKLLAESEFRNKIATKDDVRNMGLLNLVLLGIGIVACIVMIIGLQGALTEFTKFATDTFEQFRPVLDEILKNTPRVVIDG